VGGELERRERGATKGGDEDHGEWDVEALGRIAADAAAGERTMGHRVMQ
jgi:hypothetical protein